MARRVGSPLNGAKYCGNTNTKEVHDLDNENNNCQIDEIIEADHAKPYHSLATAILDGYDECFYCLTDGAQKQKILANHRIIVVGSKAPYSGFYQHTCGHGVKFFWRGQRLPVCYHIHCVSTGAPWRLINP